MLRLLFWTEKAGIQAALLFQGLLKFILMKQPFKCQQNNYKFVL
jgi:hypothetical protein